MGRAPSGSVIAAGVTLAKFHLHKHYFALVLTRMRSFLMRKDRGLRVNRRAILWRDGRGISICILLWKRLLRWKKQRRRILNETVPHCHDKLLRRCISVWRKKCGRVAAVLREGNTGSSNSTVFLQATSVLGEMLETNITSGKYHKHLGLTANSVMLAKYRWSMGVRAHVLKYFQVFMRRYCLLLLQATHFRAACCHSLKRWTRKWYIHCCIRLPTFAQDAELAIQHCRKKKLWRSFGLLWRRFRVEKLVWKERETRMCQLMEFKRSRCSLLIWIEFMRSRREMRNLSTYFRKRIAVRRWRKSSANSFIHNVVAVKRADLRFYVTCGGKAVQLWFKFIKKQQRLRRCLMIFAKLHGGGQHGSPAKCSFIPILFLRWKSFVSYSNRVRDAGNKCAALKEDKIYSRYVARWRLLHRIRIANKMYKSYWLEQWKASINCARVKWFEFQQRIMHAATQSRRVESTLNPCVRNSSKRFTELVLRSQKSYIFYEKCCAKRFLFKWLLFLWERKRVRTELRRAQDESLRRSWLLQHNAVFVKDSMEDRIMHRALMVWVEMMRKRHAAMDHVRMRYSGRKFFDIWKQNRRNSFLYRMLPPKTTPQSADFYGVPGVVSLPKKLYPPPPTRSYSAHSVQRGEITSSSAPLMSTSSLVDVAKDIPCGTWKSEGNVSNGANIKLSRKLFQSATSPTGSKHSWNGEPHPGGSVTHERVSISSAPDRTITESGDANAMLSPIMNAHRQLVLSKSKSKVLSNADVEGGVKNTKVIGKDINTTLNSQNLNDCSTSTFLMTNITNDDLNSDSDSSGAVAGEPVLRGDPNAPRRRGGNVELLKSVGQRNVSTHLDVVSVSSANGTRQVASLKSPKVATVVKSQKVSILSNSKPVIADDSCVRGYSRIHLIRNR